MARPANLRRRRLLTLVRGLRWLVVALLACAAPARARPGRVDQLPLGFVYSCAACHIFPGGPRTAFGLDAEDTLIDNGGAISTWRVDWPALHQLDSDGDGVTNGEELGDPEGTWVQGDPNPDFEASNPTDPESVPTVDDGEPCTSDLVCASGHCLPTSVGHICCDAACDGICERCDLDGAVGSCTPVPEGEDPVLDCPDTACDGAGACLEAEPTGDCTGDAECTSGHCVDGICCDTACEGPCVACDIAGSEGVCTPTAAGQDPGGECSPGTCDGAGACVFPDGVPCEGAADCTGGFCVDGVCCDSSCEGACESCDQPDLLGVCSPVGDETDDPTCEASPPVVVEDDGCALARVTPSSEPRFAGLWLVLVALLVARRRGQRDPLRAAAHRSPPGPRVDLR